MLDEKKYTQLSVKSTEKQDQMKVDVKLTNTQEFMITSLLGIKILAKKLNMKYEEVLVLICAYLKDENIAKDALTRAENAARENGIETL